MFEDVVKACPAIPQTYTDIAALLIARGEFRAALHWIDTGLKVAPADPTLRLQHGATLLSLGYAEQSLAALRGISPTGKSRFYEGMAYRALHNHTIAQTAFTDAWELGYQQPYVLYSLIEEERETGDKSAGMKHFKLFLKTFPDSDWLHVLLGDAYLNQGKDEEARQEFRKAVQSNPKLIDAHYRLGVMAFQSGDNAQALSEFQKELDLNPAFADVHLYMGETLLRLDRKQEALVYLQKALAMDPGSDLVYHRLASAFQESGQVDQAATTLRRGEIKFPHDPTFPSELARILTRLNRNKDADREVTRARILTAEQHKKQDLTRAR